MLLSVLTIQCLILLFFYFQLLFCFLFFLFFALYLRLASLFLLFSPLAVRLESIHWYDFKYFAANVGWNWVFWYNAIQIIMHKCRLRFSQLKWALDKTNIHTSLYISNSLEDLNLNQHQTFELILQVCFYYVRYSVKNIFFRVTHRRLYCVFI